MCKLCPSGIIFSRICNKRVWIFKQKFYYHTLKPRQQGSICEEWFLFVQNWQSCLRGSKTVILVNVGTCSRFSSLSKRLLRIAKGSDEVANCSFATQHFVPASGASKHPHTFHSLQIKLRIPALRPTIYIQMMKFNYSFSIWVSAP